MPHSLEYQLSKVPGLRKILKWKTSRKILKFQQEEEKRRQSDPKNLMNFEKRVFSQNGEDGIIEEIFNRIGTTDKFFVEFGIEDGAECNGRYLLEQKGWSGFWMDGNPENVKRAREKFANSPIIVLDRFVKKENIHELFIEGKVAREFDLLSIDIDGNDYWIWKELSHYKPRVVVIEYNATYLASQDWVMPYNPDHLFDGTAHFGASLLALEKLGNELGYSLVGCDSQGVNAFFVRKDCLGNHFSRTGARSHYVCPKYRGLFFGHPR